MSSISKPQGVGGTQAFTVAANDPRQPTAIADAVQGLTQAVPGATVQRVNTQAGVAVVSLPLHSIEAARAHLGSGFSIEPNQSLSMIL